MLDKDMIVNPFPNEHACRIRPPGNFRRDGDWARVPRRSASHGGKTYDVIRGQLKSTGKMEDQTYRYPKSRWPAGEARSHCRAHDGTFEAAATGNMVTANYLIENVQYRTERWEGDEYLVVPIIAMVEGVHVGSAGPGYYSLEEIARFPEAWNGVPLPVFHPMDDGGYVSASSPEVISARSVGHFFNAHFHDGRLRGEGWISVQKAKKIAPEILDIVQSNGRLEISTGLFSDHDEVTGQWNDEEYQFTVRNIRPDHIALLPGGEGACSWEDGCGVRVNRQRKGGGMKPEDKINLLAKMILDEVSHDEVRQKLQQIVDQYDTHETSLLHYIVDVYEDHFIYEARQQGQQSKFYRQNYTANDDGQVTLGDDPVQVVRETTYVEAQEKQTSLKFHNTKRGGKTMTKEERKTMVDGLIANEKAPYAEKDREALEKLEDPCLETLQSTVQRFETAAADSAKAEEEKKKKELTVEEKTKVDAAAKVKADAEAKAKGDPSGDEKPQTAEEFLEKTDMPAEIKANLTRALKSDRQEKALIIEALVKNQRNSFTKEELEAKDLPELEALAKLGDIPKDYSMRSGGESKKEIRVLEARKMEWKQ